VLTANFEKQRKYAPESYVTYFKDKYEIVDGAPLVIAVTWRSLTRRECHFILRQNESPVVSSADLEEFIFRRCVKDLFPNVGIIMNKEESIKWRKTGILPKGSFDLMKFGYVDLISKVICIYSGISPSKMLAKYENMNLPRSLAITNVFRQREIYILYLELIKLYGDTYTVQDFKNMSMAQLYELQAMAMLRDDEIRRMEEAKRRPALPFDPTKEGEVSLSSYRAMRAQDPDEQKKLALHNYIKYRRDNNAN
jgi:hypothetical protein